jgi:hypothetical protein
MSVSMTHARITVAMTATSTAAKAGTNQKESPMPGPENDDGSVIDDIINWQYQARAESLEELAVQACDKLNRLSLVLNELNELAITEPCSCGCLQEKLGRAVTEVLQLATPVAIYTLGLTHRNPDGLHVLLRPTPSAN